MKNELEFGQRVVGENYDNKVIRGVYMSPCKLTRLHRLLDDNGTIFYAKNCKPAPEWQTITGRPFDKIGSPDEPKTPEWDEFDKWVDHSIEKNRRMSAFGEPRRKTRKVKAKYPKPCAPADKSHYFKIEVL